MDFVFITLQKIEKLNTIIYFSMDYKDRLELLEELDEINKRLRWLLKRGCNDESLVDRAKAIKKELEWK